ncbi:MAG: hypothetical protein LBS23_02970 [Holosporaceae bacterium]|jgi:chromosomal replication initiation ATPase DnaA|nr:hypothetical protein [Holosporaceae bacterium]
MQQEIFSFYKTENLNWYDFIDSDENFEAITYLIKWPAWNSNGIIIFGESGVGKTHLAALWAQTANAVHILKEAVNHDPRDLFDADCNFVIDNFDNFLSVNENVCNWMFHFLNIANEKGRYFLILSRTSLNSISISLNDLKSRLLAIPSINVKNPSDELLFKIAQKIAKDLEIFVSNDVLLYILNNANRDVRSVTEILKTLDKLSLQRKKAISIAFVKQHLESIVMRF